MKKRPGWSIYKTNWNNLMNSLLIPNYEERYEKKNIVLAGKRGQKGFQTLSSSVRVT